MNERIRELYRQANEQAHQQACEKSKTNRPQNNTVWNEFVPLFAELIVREYETLLPEICPWDGPKDSPMKGWHVQFVARKHFGVEE